MDEELEKYLVSDEYQDYLVYSDSVEYAKFIEELAEDELIKSTRTLNMKRPRAELPVMSVTSRLSSGGTESDPSSKGAKPTYRSVKLETKHHTRYSEVENQPYTTKQQKADMKRAIKEEIEQKMEEAGEANTNPRIKYPYALRNKKTTTVTTEKGKYTTLEKNVIVGIHGKRFDVKIVNPKMVFKH